MRPHRIVCRSRMKPDELLASVSLISSARPSTPVEFMKDITRREWYGMLFDFFRAVMFMQPTKSFELLEISSVGISLRMERTQPLWLMPVHANISRPSPLKQKSVSGDKFGTSSRISSFEPGSIAHSVQSLAWPVMKTKSSRRIAIERDGKVNPTYFDAKEKALSISSLIETEKTWPFSIPRMIWDVSGHQFQLLTIVGADSFSHSRSGSITHWQNPGQMLLTISCRDGTVSSLGKLDTASHSCIPQESTTPSSFVSIVPS
mmetsp:Transcript_14243/g.38104  ORF Transcript_14243/g.38104 Transcript_14243/m.38104 type:complete len:261 (+) Transcript_14243:2053-2835(+)